MVDNILGIQHLGMPSPDLEKSEKWYSEILGFEKIEEKVVQGRAHAIFMKKGNLVLEMYYTNEEEMEEVKQRKHGFIDHVALNVKDIDVMWDYMKKTDVEFLDKEIDYLPFFKGVRFFTVLGPSGEKVEFNQYL